MRKIYPALVGAAFALYVVAAAVTADETKFDLDEDGNGNAGVTFAPNKNGVTAIRAVFAKVGVDTNLIVWTRTGNKRTAPSNATPGDVIIFVDNSDSLYSVNDRIAYLHANNNVENMSKVTNTLGTDRIVIDVPLAEAGTGGQDFVYKMQKLLLIPLDPNKALFLTGDIMTSPGDSPLHIEIEGENPRISITVDND